MKRKIEKDYFCQVQRIFKSKMNGGNMVLEINCRVVAVVGYAAGMVEWTKILELQIVDKKMRKLMTLHESLLHLLADIDRLYFKRSVGGRGFMNVEDSVK